MIIEIDKFIEIDMIIETDRFIEFDMIELIDHL